MNPVSLEGTHVTLDALLRLRPATLAANRETLKARLGTSGSRLSRFRGRGIEFTEVRAYQPGDDVRSIDWKVTARRTQPHTKVYHEERERPELLIVDQTRSMFFGTGRRLKSVTAAETAAVLAWQYLDRGDRVGGLVLGEQGQALVRPRRRTAATVRFLRAIESANQCLSADMDGDPPSLAAALTEAKRLAPTGHGVHIISGFSEPMDILKRPLAGLALNNEVRLIFVYDSFEAAPPIGRFQLLRGTERLVFNTHHAPLRERFAAEFAERMHRLRRICEQTGCRLLELRNQDSLLEGKARAT